MTGISPKVCWQVLFKVSGYGDVVTVGPHTFIMSQVLKLTTMCNLMAFYIFMPGTCTQYYFPYSSSYGILNCKTIHIFASANIISTYDLSHWLHISLWNDVPDRFKSSSIC